MNHDDKTSQENTNQQPAKGREPDFDAHQVIKNDGGENWVKIGAMWEGKDGYISGDTVHGRIVLQSRKAKEALQEMRVQNQQSTPTQQQKPETQPSQ